MIGRATIPTLPPGIFVLPLTPGASLRNRSTADLWGDLPVIRALSASAPETNDLRREIVSVQPGTKPKPSTQDMWNLPPRKK